MNIGKKRRLERIINTESGRLVMIPIDDGLLDGPEEGLRDMKSKVKEIVDGGVDAILGFKGVMKNSFEEIGDVGFIMNLTASTSLGQHTRKILIGNVEEALRYGADGVGVHVNVSSMYETEMLHNLGLISSEAENLGVPLLTLMYPRKEGFGKDENYLDLKENNNKDYTKLVRHAARIGAELGADIIKVPYTGSAESFSSVVESCGDVPVVIAGGPKLDDKEIFEMAYGAVSAGGAGVCFGRNGFNRENTTEFAQALRAIVHEGKSPSYALRILNKDEKVTSLSRV
ncbi:fructose-bisphosphate aldolase [Candidatus Woesearchaeota archaeon]|nr:fructose-bisphosphate aldolase [Candidatus Woesearchaeota archaeon]